MAVKGFDDKKKIKPIFEGIFADKWAQLPPIIKKHYSNRPFCKDKTTFTGKMDVMCKWYLKPFMWLSGTAPSYSAEKIDVTVNFRSSPDNDGFTLERIFNYKSKKNPHIFRTRMHHIKDNHVLEIMRYGFFSGILIMHMMEKK